MSNCATKSEERAGRTFAFGVIANKSCSANFTDAGVSVGNADMLCFCPFATGCRGDFDCDDNGCGQDVRVCKEEVLNCLGGVSCYNRFFSFPYASFPRLPFCLTFPRRSSLLPEGGIHRFCSLITSDLNLHQSVLSHRLCSSFYSSPLIMFSLVPQ